MNCSKIETPNWMAPEGEDCNSSISFPLHPTPHKTIKYMATAQMCKCVTPANCPGLLGDVMTLLLVWLRVILHMWLRHNNSLVCFSATEEPRRGGSEVCRHVELRNVDVGIGHQGGTILRSLTHGNWNEGNNKWIPVHLQFFVILSKCINIMAVSTCPLPANTK